MTRRNLYNSEAEHARIKRIIIISASEFLIVIILIALLTYTVLITPFSNEARTPTTPSTLPVKAAIHRQMSSERAHYEQQARGNR